MSSSSSLVSLSKYSNYFIYGFQLWALVLLGNALFDYLIVYYDDLNDDRTYTLLESSIFSVLLNNIISIVAGLIFFGKSSQYIMGLILIPALA